MSLWDKLKGLVEGPDNPAIYTASGPAGELLTALGAIVDPEVGLDIVTMGLIRGVQVEDGQGRLKMTLTTAGCPMADEILGEVSAAIEALGLEPAIELVMDPPWSPDQIDDAGREKLRT